MSKYILLVFLAGFASGQSLEQKTVWKKSLGQLKGKTLEGKTLDLTKKTPSLLLVNFWANWCAPCKREIPSLIKFAQKYKGKISIIGVNADEGNSKELIAIHKNLKLNFDSLSDPQLKLTTDVFKISDLPATIIFKNKEPIFFDDGAINFQENKKILEIIK